MKSPTIGIKIADGSFYPIMEESVLGKKRLSLAPASENQRNVKIDIYRGLGSSMENARKIGTLAVEPSADPQSDIDLMLEVDSDGRMTASAGPQGSSQRQTLSVSLDDYKLDEFGGFEEVAQNESVEELNDEVRGRRDQDILEDDSLVPEEGLDSIDGLAVGDLSLDSLDLNDEAAAPKVRPKSDKDILEDDSFVPEEGLGDFGDIADLNLDDDLPGSPKPEIGELDGLGDFSLDDNPAEGSQLDGELGELSLEGEPAAAPLESDDLPGLDDLSATEDAGADLDAFESLSLDDEEVSAEPAGLDELPDLSMESLSFDDTDLSKPSTTKTPPAKAPVADDDFSMDDLSMDEGDEPLPLPTGLGEESAGGLDDFSMDSLDDETSTGSSDDFGKGMDFDFPSMDSEARGNVDDSADLSDLNPPDDEPAPAPRGKPKKETVVKPKAPASDRAVVDKFVLIMSLLSFSLLVLVIVVLLVINMVKAAMPQTTSQSELRLLALKPAAGQVEPELVNRDLLLSDPGLRAQVFVPADQEALELPGQLAGANLAVVVQTGDRTDDLDRLYGRSQGLMSAKDITTGARLVVPSH